MLCSLILKKLSTAYIVSRSGRSHDTNASHGRWPASSNPSKKSLSALSSTTAIRKILCEWTVESSRDASFLQSSSPCELTCSCEASPSAKRRSVQSTLNSILQDIYCTDDMGFLLHERRSIQLKIVSEKTSAKEKQRNRFLGRTPHLTTQSLSMEGNWKTWRSLSTLATS